MNRLVIWPVRSQTHFLSLHFQCLPLSFSSLAHDTPQGGTAPRQVRHHAQKSHAMQRNIEAEPVCQRNPSRLHTRTPRNMTWHHPSMHSDTDTDQNTTKSRQFRTHLDQSRNCLHLPSRISGCALLNLCWSTRGWVVTTEKSQRFGPFMINTQMHFSQTDFFDMPKKAPHSSEKQYRKKTLWFETMKKWPDVSIRPPT